MLTWSEPAEIAVKGLSGDTFEAPWLVLLEDKMDATHVKIEAEGTLEFTRSVLRTAGLDGYMQSSVPDSQKPLPGCPLGALIGKFGGSSSTCRKAKETPDGAAPGFDEPFAIGSFCVVQVPTDIEGPLYVGFNAFLRPVRLTGFKVKVTAGILAIPHE